MEKKRETEAEMKRRFEEIFGAIEVARRGRGKLVLGAGEMPDFKIVDQDTAFSATFRGYVKPSPSRQKQMKVALGVVQIINGVPEVLIKENLKQPKFRVSNTLNGTELKAGATLEETIQKVKEYIETNFEGREILKKADEVISTGIN